MRATPTSDLVVENDRDAEVGVDKGEGFEVQVAGAGAAVETYEGGCAGGEVAVDVVGGFAAEACGGVGEGDLAALRRGWVGPFLAGRDGVGLGG